MSSVPVHRLVEYFCVVSYGNELIPVSDQENEARSQHRIHEGFFTESKSFQSQTAHSSQPSTDREKFEKSEKYFNSSPPSLIPDHLLQCAYKTEIISRFPVHEHKFVPFPPGLSMFCLPDDLTLISGFPPMPIFYSFVTTQANGVKMYGNCLKFYEPVPLIHLEELVKKDRIARRKLRKTQRNSNFNGNALNSSSISVNPANSNQPGIPNGSFTGGNGSSNNSLCPSNSTTAAQSPMAAVSSIDGKKNSIFSSDSLSAPNAGNGITATESGDPILFEYANSQFDGDSDNDNDEGLLEFPAA